MSLLRFSYFFTPYDAQASSACSALIIHVHGKYSNTDTLSIIITVCYFI